jgi:NADH dehydrogenase
LDAAVNENANGGTVAVTGANSAVGRALLAQIAQRDRLRAVALVRREAALNDLPRASGIAPRVVPYDQPEQLVEALTGADCVVHLAGILFESRTTNYRTGNVESTRALVAAAQSAGVRHIVLVSSLGADPRSSNGYFRSKGEAERLVIGSGLKTTIIRTPLLLGPDTAGGRALLRTAAGTSARVLGGGSHRLRPLDVDDLCRAILGYCRESGAGVRICAMVGPTILTQRELLQRTARLLGHDLAVRSTPVWLARLLAGFAGLVRTGGLTPAVIEVITSDEANLCVDRDTASPLTPLSDTLARLCETRAS